MNHHRSFPFIVSMLLIAALALPAMAQPERGPAGGERDDRMGRPDGPPDGPGPGGMGPGGPGPGMHPGGPMGGGMGRGGQGMRPAVAPDMQKFEMLRGYIELVDRFARLSRDPTTAGVAAVLSANDILRQRGTDAAIEYFNKALGEVKNEAVQRAIRIQLIDLYKQAGQADKAIEQLDILMKAAPAGAAATPPAQ